MSRQEFLGLPSASPPSARDWIFWLSVSSISTPYSSHEAYELPARDLASRHHRHEVANHRLGNADVVTDHLEQILVGDPFGEELHGWHAETLFEYRSVVR